MLDLTPETIRTARESLGLTRIELAGRMLDATPEELAMAKRIEQVVKNIRYWETGTTAPSPVYADLLTHALNVKE